jgi:hypothetical protein
MPILRLDQAVAPVIRIRRRAEPVIRLARPRRRRPRRRSAPERVLDPVPVHVNPGRRPIDEIMLLEQGTARRLLHLEPLQLVVVVERLPRPRDQIVSTVSDRMRLDQTVVAVAEHDPAQGRLALEIELLGQPVVSVVRELRLASAARNCTTQDLTPTQKVSDTDPLAKNRLCRSRTLSRDQDRSIRREPAPVEA